MRPRILLAILLAVALALAPGAAPAAAQDTAAVAINTRDGSELFRFAFNVRRTMQDVVDNTNAAVAVASCTECETIAISFQVVLAGGDPSTVTPTNLALAINEECTSCVTAAYAYQFVLGTDGPVHFTAEGNQRLAELRNRLRALEEQELTPDQLQVALDEAADELSDILAHELVATGPTEDAGEGEARPPPEEEQTASPEPEATETPTPTPTTTPEATATAEPTATATP
jgi:putative peptide zinc metalloprotease protein